MKLQILKNIKYKGEAWKIGDTVDVDRKDLLMFIECGIVAEDTRLEPSRFEKMTKDELGEFLEGKGVKYNPLDNKQKLIDMAEWISND